MSERGGSGEATGRTAWRVSRRLLGLVLVATVLGVGHHVDHVIRGNHVGWPVAPGINPFTYSLVIYPVVAVGLYLTVRNRVGPAYWAVVALLGLGMLTAIHFGPWAVEPPSHVIEPHDSRAVGLFAFAWLLALLATLAVTAAYALREWSDRRETGSGRA